MARLHLKFKRDAYDAHIIELTERFFEERYGARMRRRKGLQNLPLHTLFDSWVHGACIVYGLPFPAFVVDPKAPTPHGFYTTVGFYTPPAEGNPTGSITLRRYSAISLFHQFRHHMQAHGHPEPWDHDKHGRDAQQWACSLFYQCDKRTFRKWVRRGRIAGVTPDDLLKRVRP